MAGKDDRNVEMLEGASNFLTWKTMAIMRLRAKENAYDVCLGILRHPIPVEGNDHAEEMRRYQLGVRGASYVFSTTISSKVFQLLTGIVDPKEVWDKLHDMYESKTEIAGYKVSEDFFNFRISPNESMLLNCKRLETIVARMTQLDLAPKETVTITRLLTALPSEYEPLKQSWATRTTNKTLADLIALLTSESERRECENKALGSALFVSKPQVSSQKGKFQQKGNFSKQGNYNKGNYNKGGNRKINGTNTGMFPRCKYCSRDNHAEEDCRYKKYSGKKAEANLQETNQNPYYGKGDAFVCEAYVAGTDDNAWIVDSGATDHMTNRNDWLVEYKEFAQGEPILVGKEKVSMKAMGVGTVIVETLVNGKWIEKRIEQVKYVPELRRNLFSVNTVTEKGFAVGVWNNKTITFVKNGETVAVGAKSGKFWKMLFRVKMSEVNLTHSLQEWHEKCGHIGKVQVQKVLKRNGITYVNDEKFCDACALGKQHKETYQTKTQRAKEVGEIIHMDLSVNASEPSLGGSKYFMVLTDDFSRYRKVYFLAEKSQAAKYIKDYVLWFENQTSKSIKAFMTDGGLEFDNVSVKSFLESKGIEFRMSTPYTPQQNGVAERTNRTVTELARTMLQAKSLPRRLWAEAVSCAVYVLNRAGSSPVGDQTPYELVFKKKVRYNNLHVFGSECFVFIPKQHRKKFDANSKRGIFVGYNEDVDGYRVWFEGTNVVKRTKDVIFPPQVNGCNFEKLSISDPEEDEDEEIEEQAGPAPAVVQEMDQQESPQQGRVLRNRMQIRAPERLIEVLLVEPNTYEEAIKSPEMKMWKQAMDDELESMHENHVWQLTELPKGRKAIDNRWVFKVKHDETGQIERYKARLVVKGYSQVAGIDYNETFSPVARFETIRSVLSVAATEKLELAQFDVKTAFLYGELSEEIFMKQPIGFSDGTDRVCKLQKSLYGLKQAPRCWNKRFKDVLDEYGLKQSQADPCMFYNVSEKDKLLVALYVDDGLVACSSKQLLNQFLTELEQKFKVTKKGLVYFLGLQIKRDDEGAIWLNQTNYADSVVKRFKMEMVSPVSTPMDAGLLKGTGSEGKALKGEFPYREAVGSLMYLAIGTRPDIAFAVSFVSRFLENPEPEHVNAVKRILRYVNGTKELAIKYSASKEEAELLAFSDADFAGDHNERKSVTGSLFLFAGGPVQWKSQKQNVVAQSSTESEYIAASEATKELVWLVRLYREISNTKVGSTLQVDNQSAIRLIKNPEFHKRTKHIDVRYHYVRDMYDKGELEVEFVGSQDQLADILTKPLPKAVFQSLRKQIGLYI